TRVVVVPPRFARGIQNKILEALAARKPVIASPNALDGLEVVPDRHLLEAGTAEQWVKCLESLFKSERRCGRLASAGSQFVREQHHWECCLQPLAAIIGEVQRVAPPLMCPVLS